MGNHRFRLSDMMPNAWFQKLNSKNRNVSSNKNLHASSYSSLSLSSNSTVSSPSQLDKPPPPPLSDQRKSYYFTRPEEPPRRSSRRRRSTRRRTRPHDAHPPLVSSSISAGCSCRSTIESVCTKPPQKDDEGNRGLTPGDAFENMIPSCNCTTTAVDGKPIDTSRASRFDRRELPPIITKKQQPIRRFSGNPLSSSSSSSSPGVKLRTNTPRIGSRKGRRSESFAVVKSSRDPGRDFRESMVEMIVENNLRGTADLEELLACYLSLNTDEYHDLIIAVFKQIWFDLNRLRPN